MTAAMTQHQISLAQTGNQPLTHGLFPNIESGTVMLNAASSTSCSSRRDDPRPNDILYRQRCAQRRALDARSCIESALGNQYRDPALKGPGSSFYLALDDLICARHRLLASGRPEGVLRQCAAHPH